jgi:hypothetical protein
MTSQTLFEQLQAKVSEVLSHSPAQDVEKNLNDASYTDWKIGVTKDIGFGVVGLAYVGTNAKGDAGEPYRNPFNKDLGKDRLLLTFGKTF